MATRRLISLWFSASIKTGACSLRRHSRKIATTGGITCILGSALFIKPTVKAKEVAIGLTDEDENALKIEDLMAEPINNSSLLDKSPEMMHRMEKMCLLLQGQLCREIERIEGTTKFKVDRWLRCERSEGGGISCVLEDGAVFERAGVNISVVSGHLRPEAVKAMNSSGRELPEDEDMTFKAVGISSVIHPRNPMVPTMHFNYRYFEVTPDMSDKQWWFGGGADLTPYYLSEKDAKHFHCTYKAACDMHGPSYYTRFKKWCDDYFYIKHRCMRRGIGGIFFDDFKTKNIDACFSFVKSCADAVIPSYIPIVMQHKNDKFSLKEREWQLQRRGHYVEFNLLYDRGTKFGFSTPGARHESILMSLPPKAAWHYCYEPEPGTKEAELYEVLRNPVDWVTI